MYDLLTKIITKWDMNMHIEKRDLLFLPLTREDLFQYGTAVVMRDLGDDNFEIRYLHANNKSIKVSKERLYNFLKGGDDKEIMDFVYKRVEFLDYDIIEHLTDDRNYYYQLLDLMKLLYNMGYWTYGGFVNYNVIYPRYNKITAITMDGGNLRFKLDIDGTITDVKVTDDSYLSIIDDLVKLGARVA